MNWSSLNDFLAMGGYGLYVWGSYGMCALVFVAECWSWPSAARRCANCPLDDARRLERKSLHHEA